MTKIVDVFATLRPPGLLKAWRVLAGRSLAGPGQMATVRASPWAAAARSRFRARNEVSQQHVLSRSIFERWLGEDRFPNLWNLCESCPLGMLVLDNHDEILKVNARTEQLFGYESGELVGEPFSRLVPELGPNDRFTCGDTFSSKSQGAVPAPVCSIIARRRNGSEFPVEIGFSRSSLKKGAAILAFVEDKSEHYELLRNRRDLAHLTRISTMGELAGSLAHELNQPLTAILSNVQAAQRFMAAEPIDVAEVREILNDIVQDDYRASEVIRRIRSVVKKGDMELAPLDLATVIRDVMFLLHSDAIMRETSVILEVCDGLPTVYADKVQLQQVTLNLLLNAFDAMSRVLPSERVVSIALTREGGDMVRIAVRDSGQGLTIGKLDTIFKPFYTSKPHGLGLGLSISRSIVEHHGGRLWAENNIDRGATFYVTLPTGSPLGRKPLR
jgi:two-component system, LuxR family, sensor kinase FixL